MGRKDLKDRKDIKDIKDNKDGAGLSSLLSLLSLLSLPSFRSFAAYRLILADPPPMTCLTSSRVIMLVSPRVDCSRPPWAEPKSTIC